MTTTAPTWAQTDLGPDTALRILSAADAANGSGRPRREARDRIRDLSEELLGSNAAEPVRVYRLIGYDGRKLTGDSAQFLVRALVSIQSNLGKVRDFRDVDDEMRAVMIGEELQSIADNAHLAVPAVLGDTSSAPEPTDDPAPDDQEPAPAHDGIEPEIPEAELDDGPEIPAIVDVESSEIAEALALAIELYQGELSTLAQIIESTVDHRETLKAELGEIHAVYRRVLERQEAGE